MVDYRGAYRRCTSDTISLSAEHLLLTESLPKKDSILIGTQAAPNSPGTMSAVSTMAGETDFSHVESGQESYVNQGLQAFARGAATAGEQVWSNVASPLLQRVGSAVRAPQRMLLLMR